MARLRLSNKVEKDDVSEPLRLLEMSKDSLNQIHEHKKGHISNTSDKIFAVVRELAGINDTVKIADVMDHNEGLQTRSSGSLHWGIGRAQHMAHQSSQNKDYFSIKVFLYL